LYRVVKTSLFQRALETAGLPSPGDLSSIPLAVGFCFDNVPGVAKALTAYAKNSEAMVIRVGMMGQQILSTEDLKAISNLPPIEVLRSQIAGLLNAPAANLVGVLQAGIGQIINVVNAHAEKGQAAAA
jgi:large subunit ribosomal protein L10